MCMCVGACEHVSVCAHMCVSFNIAYSKILVRGPSILHIARLWSDLTCNCMVPDSSVFKTILCHCVVFHYLILCIRCNMHLY